MAVPEEKMAIYFLVFLWTPFSSES